MRVELRNGKIVDVPDPRESAAARYEADKAKNGYWVPEYEDGVPVRMRWHAPVGTAAKIAEAAAVESDRNPQ